MVEALVLEAGQLVQTARGEDPDRERMRPGRVVVVQPAGQPGKTVGRQPCDGPDQQVAGDQRGQPGRPARPHRPGVDGDDRRHGGQHHRRHHQRPDGDESTDAEAHRAGHPVHTAGEHDCRRPRPGGQEEQGRCFRPAEPPQRRPGRLVRPDAHPDQENGAEKPLWPDRPQSIPNVDSVAFVAGATVSVEFDGWNTLASWTEGLPSPATKSVTWKLAPSPTRTEWARPSSLYSIGTRSMPSSSPMSGPSMAGGPPRWPASTAPSSSACASDAAASRKTPTRQLPSAMSCGVSRNSAKLSPLTSVPSISPAAT